MTFLPVVERELRATARRRGTFRTRLVFALAAVAAAGVVALFTGALQGNTGGVGAWVFKTLSVMAFSFALVTGVFLTSDCLSGEKREGTLGLLFLTDLKGYDVVLGKLMATSLNAFYGLLAIFPVLAISLTMGGVTHGEFWRMVLVFPAMLLLSLTSGLFVSSISRQDNRAMGGTFLLLTLIAGGLPLSEFLLVQVGAANPLTVSLPSPLTAYRLSFDAAYRAASASYWNSLLMSFFASGVLLFLASVLLPRLWQEEPKLARALRGEGQIRENGSAERRAKRARLLDVNPVYWLTSRLGGPPSVWWAGFALVSAPMFVSSPFLQPSGSWIFSMIALVPLLLVRIMVGLQACRFFVEARRSGSLELLLCTPLSVNEILRGQWLALRRRHCVPVAAVFGILLVRALWAMAQEPDWIVWSILVQGSYALGGAATFLTDVFAIAWLGMLVGLTSTKLNLAPGRTLLYGVVLPAFALCVPRILIDIPLILWARDKLHRELRALICQRYSAAVAP